MDPEVDYFEVARYITEREVQKVLRDAERREAERREPLDDPPIRFYAR